MSHKVWTRRLSLNLSRGIGWRLAVGLAFGMLLVAGMRESRAAADLRVVSTPAQEQNRLAAQRKFEEAEALRTQGTVESLGLAVKKYEEALLLFRAIGDRLGEAITLNNIGLVYESLGEMGKALDFYTRAL